MPPEVITLERLESLAKSKGIEPEVGEGSLWIPFSDMDIWFAVSDDVVRSVVPWDGVLADSEEVSVAIHLANSFNQMLPAPKVVVEEETSHTIPEGGGTVRFEYSVPNFIGYTDQQMADLFVTILSYHSDAMDLFTKALPQVLKKDSNTNPGEGE